MIVLTILIMTTVNDRNYNQVHVHEDDHDFDNPIARITVYVIIKSHINTSWPTQLQIAFSCL